MPTMVDDEDCIVDALCAALQSKAGVKTQAALLSALEACSDWQKYASIPTALESTLKGLEAQRDDIPFHELARAEQLRVKVSSVPTVR